MSARKARLFVSARDMASRFRQPVPGVFPLQADIEACLRPLEPARFVIEHRGPGADWTDHSVYGTDKDQACERAAWWNALCRRRREFRVCALVGGSRTVIFGGGERHA